MRDYRTDPMSVEALTRQGCPCYGCDWWYMEEDCPDHGIAVWYRNHYANDTSHDFGD